MAAHQAAGLFRPSARAPASGPCDPRDFLHRRSAHARRGTRRILRPGVLQGGCVARAGAVDPDPGRRRDRPRLERAHRGGPRPHHALDAPRQLPRPADRLCQCRVHRRDGMPIGMQPIARPSTKPRRCAPATPSSALPTGTCANLACKGRQPTSAHRGFPLSWPRPSSALSHGGIHVRRFGTEGICNCVRFRRGPDGSQCPRFGHDAKAVGGARQRARRRDGRGCAKNGYKVVAVVVDLDGVRRGPVLRGDGAPIHSMDNAYYKAYSIASLGLARKEESTKAIADRMAKAAPTTVPQTPLPNVTYAVGGVAIMAGGNTIRRTRRERRSRRPVRRGVRAPRSRRSRSG